jgi:SAM-dependent methyltransferase
LRPFQELEARWYESLEAGTPDYSVYDDAYFISDIWACWVHYSRKYLTAIKSPKSLADKSIVDDMRDVAVVADLGCGFGYTTAALKELFPSATVFGTNFGGGRQWRLASMFGEQYGFSMFPSVEEFGKPVDLIFASEYFEHIEDAISHVASIVESASPRYMVTANAFGTTSVGHFIKYRCGGGYCDGKTASRLFNEAMGSFGYENIETNCWNGRPAYWSRAEARSCQRRLF